MLDEQAQLTKTMALHARVEKAQAKVPNHIDRQENYLPGHDIKNFEDWLIEKRQKAAAETANYPSSTIDEHCKPEKID